MSMQPHEPGPDEPTTDAGKSDGRYEIIVSGQEFAVDHERVTFEQVVKLAFPTPPSPDSRFTVTFFDAVKPEEGTLKSGGSVLVKVRGTVFNVKPTVTS